MNIIKTVIILFTLGLNISGCQTARYPMMLKNVGDSKEYPKSTTGFQRGEIIIYAPENVSTGYNRFTQDSQIAVTTYDYSPSIKHSELFQMEKSEILKYAKNATLLFDKKEIFNKGKKKFHTLSAGFSATEVFANKKQKIYTEMILIKVDDKFIKSRMSTPFAQKEKSKKLTRKLLNQLGWD